MHPATVHSLESSMFVRRCVDGSHSTILYLHGLGESGLCFEAIATHPSLLVFDHIIPDLPGYGRSPWPREPMDLETTAAHLAKWMAPSKPCVVVGHSMGGVLATILAESHPELVQAVIDVDGNISSGDCSFSGPAAAMPSSEFATRGMVDLQDRIYQQGIADHAFRGYYASLRLCDPRTFHLHARQLVAQSAADNLAERLAALPMPKWYVAGRPRGACSRSLVLLGRAQVQTIPIGSSGHWPFIDQPDAFATALAGLIG